MYIKIIIRKKQLGTGHLLTWGRNAQADPCLLSDFPSYLVCVCFLFFSCCLTLDLGHFCLLLVLSRPIFDLDYFCFLFSRIVLLLARVIFAFYFSRVVLFLIWIIFVLYSFRIIPFSIWVIRLFLLSTLSFWIFSFSIWITFVFYFESLCHLIIGSYLFLPLFLCPKFCSHHTY